MKPRDGKEKPVELEEKKSLPPVALSKPELKRETLAGNRQPFDSSQVNRMSLQPYWKSVLGSKLISTRLFR